MRSSLQALGLMMALSLTLLPDSQAASVLITNATFDGSTNAIVSSTGSLLTGTYVGVGYISGLSDAQLQSLDAAMFGLLTTGDAFKALDSSTGWWELGAGVLEGNAQANIQAGSDFIGQSIYSIIGNAATLAESTELLIFKHPGNFAQDDPFFSATATLDLTSGNGTLLWGNSGVISGDYFGEGSHPAFSTASAIPEPSRLLFLAVGFMGLMLRRRR